MRCNDSTVLPPPPPHSMRCCQHIGKRVSSKPIFLLWGAKSQVLYTRSHIQKHVIFWPLVSVVPSRVYTVYHHGRGRELLKVAEGTGECIISGRRFGGRLRLGFFRV